MIKSLTSLRGLFILFIFLHHADVYPGGGTLGVAFFFVLSGFSMTLGYGDKVLDLKFNHKSYLMRRCLKVFPLHWITLAMDIPLVLLGNLSWWLIPIFFLNAMLLQTTIPIEEVYFSYNAVSWFLANVFLFSIAFPFLYRRIHKMIENKKLGIIVSLMVFVYVLIVVMLPKSLYHPVLYISPYIRISDYIIGILLASFFIKIRDKDKIVGYINRWGQFFVLISILILIAESIWIDPTYQLIAPCYWPLIAILILISSIAEPNNLHLLKNRFFVWLGEYSFVIFLLHRLVLRYTPMIVPFPNKTIRILVCFVFTLFLSYIMDKCILKPLTQWLVERLQPSMTARS